MDYPEDSNLSASEWAMYTSSGTGQEDPLGEEAPQNPEHREALTKATKDLMSLDTDRWTSSSDLSMDHRPEMAQQPFNRYGNHAGMDQDRVQGRQQLSHQQQIQHLQQQQQQRHNSFSRAQGSFAMHHPQHLQHTGTSHESAAHLSHRPSPAVSSPTAVSGSGPSRQKRMSLSLSTAQAVPVVSTSGSASTSSSSIPNSATASSSHLNGRPHVNGSTNGAAPPTGPHSNKRARISPSPPTTIGVNPSSTGAPGLPKQQALLSPSQKKANHIQSEQKRRANIRRGYEALCETVPALREAIREEEEAMENAKAAGGKAAAAGKKKVRGRKGQGGNAKDDDKERIDGRAGPRSENVVLSKSESSLQLSHLQSSCTGPIPFPIATYSLSLLISTFSRD